MGGVDFTPMLKVSSFIMCLYFAGILCRKCGVSPVIGEMVVGVLLGPNSPFVKGFVPYADFFVLAGNFGVTLMIFESGMHLNFAMIKKVGGKALVVAILGTFLPIATGIGVATAFGFTLWPVGLAVGVALAPTSVGMALKMLGEKKQLGELFGQLIVTAAFIDDIFSLVALTMLVQIGLAQQSGAALSLWAVVSPLIYSVAFCVGGALLAYPLDTSAMSKRRAAVLSWMGVGLFPRVLPPLIEALTDIATLGLVKYLKETTKRPVIPASLRSEEGSASRARPAEDIMHDLAAGLYVKGRAQKAQGVTQRKSFVHYADHYGEGRHAHQDVKFYVEDRVLLTIMFALLLGYGWVASGIGSHLLGAFIAGVSFCWMPDHAALILWHSQVKRIAQWLIRLFFGATVAFSIPVNMMLNIDALWRGLLLGLGPCIATKIAAGVFTGANKWVVGFAMVGRGEFAYLVAQTAQAMLLNPAPPSFNAWANAHVDIPEGLVAQPGGYFCYMNDCGATNATRSVTMSVGTHGRMLGGGGGGDSGVGEWCRLPNDAPMLSALGHALPGVHYWKVGQACSDHAEACDCELMLPAQAFSMTVWALVMASVLAPLGFGLALDRRLGEKHEGKRAAPPRAAPEVQVTGGVTSEAI